MELHEVKSLRERRFGLTPKTAIRDASGAREFIHRVGFCFTRAETGLLLPSFIGAVVLTPEALVKAPVKAATKSKKPASPRTGEDIILPLLREKSVFEGRLLKDRSTLVSSPFLPYFYALVGEAAPGAKAAEPDPPEAAAPAADGDAPDDAVAESDGAPENKKVASKKTATAAKKKKKPAAVAKKPAPVAAGAPAGASAEIEAAVYKILDTDGPTGAKTLAAKCSKASGLGESEMNDAVRKLESRLKVATIDHSDSEGPIYDTFDRFRPDAVREGKKLPRIEAAMRILGRYFETVIAAEASHVSGVFAGVFSAEELPDLLKTLEERKEVDPDTRLVPGRTYWICREAAWGDL